MRGLKKVGITFAATLALVAFAAPQPVATAAPASPAICFRCLEGCTSGKTCRAYEKCENGSCQATVNTVNCRND